MKRLLAVLITAFLPAGLVIGVLWATSESGLPAAAHARLSQYLQYPAAVARPPYGVRQIGQASLPWNFSADMSGASFGDSVIFRTTHNQLAPDPAWPLGIMTPWSLHAGRQGAQPLPFPPRDLWCVRLGGVTGGDTRVIFIALHEDLDNADWIVHEARPAVTRAALLADLSSVGCDLGLGQ